MVKVCCRDRKWCWSHCCNNGEGVL
jgi:hypothetical protein